MVPCALAITAAVVMCYAAAAAAATAPPAPPAPCSQLVPYFSQTITVIEAENLTTAAAGRASGWEPRAWAHGGNYFASTVNNVFHSRRAFLHADAAATGAVASGTFHIAAADRYTVMIKYEALYRFETAFEVVIEQAGKTLLKRVYGRRPAPKVWGMGNARNSKGGYGYSTYPYQTVTGRAAPDPPGQCGFGLNAECVWAYGSVENMVWEGVNTTVALAAGSGTITLSAVADPSCVPWAGNEDCLYADRNVDAIMLLPNRSDIDLRFSSVKDNSVLAFDGLFSQAGEVFLKYTNHNRDKNCTFEVPLMYMHNPYYGQHLYLNRTVEVSVPPMATSDWVDAGAMMDTLNHGTWNFGGTKGCGKNYTVAVGVRTDPFDHTGGDGSLDGGVSGPPSPTIVPVRGAVFDMRQNDSQMVVDASTRASRRVRHSGADFVEIMASLDAQTPQIHGKPLDVLGLWASTFGGGHFNMDTPAGVASHPQLNPTAVSLRASSRSDSRLFFADPYWHCNGCRYTLLLQAVAAPARRSPA
jgi:hypothetical protein